ncbi:unnamed protein product [Discosporangium mesarthrocarpum]
MALHVLSPKRTFFPPLPPAAQNCLSGPVPEWLGELSTLKGLVLYLNNNCLEGSIPGRLVNCESLKVLYLNNNHLSGLIPHSLRHLRDLAELNLEANDLHGQARAGRT